MGFRKVFKHWYIYAVVHKSMIINNIYLKDDKKYNSLIFLI